MELFWNEALLIGGFAIGIIAGLHVGYDRGRGGRSFWTGRPAAPSPFCAEKILDNKLYSTLAARLVGRRGSHRLYLTAGGEFFTVFDHCGGQTFERLGKTLAREWVLSELPAREGREVLEEWFGERVELA